MPNGEDLGYAMGDFDPYEANGNHTAIYNKTNIIAHRSTASASEVVDVAGTPHPWGIFFTVLGTILLDFDADACQSPARAYLLDVTIAGMLMGHFNGRICYIFMASHLSEDHAKGLSTFTIMAGLGGFMGYSLGGINWDATAIGKMVLIIINPFWCSHHTHVRFCSRCCTGRPRPRSVHSCYIHIHLLCAGNCYQFQ